MSSFASDFHANMLTVTLIGVRFPSDIYYVRLWTFARMVRAAKLYAAIFY